MWIPAPSPILPAISCCGGSIAIREGTDLTDTLVASVNAVMPALVAQSTSGNAAWIFVSGTVNVSARNVISHAAGLDDNMNFDAACLGFNSSACVISRTTLQKARSGTAVHHTFT